MTYGDVPMPGEWTERALCKGSDLNFYPSQPMRGGQSLELRAAVKACKELCRKCPVKADCLEHAVKYDEPGLWAGTTRDKRRSLARGERVVSRRPINHGTIGGYIAHIRRGEELCRPCKDAHAMYQRVNRAERMQRRETA